MLKTYIVINQYNEVLDIETNLGLLKGLPKEVLSKLNISSAYLSGETEKEIEVVIISGDNVDNISHIRIGKPACSTWRPVGVVCVT